MSSTLFLQLYRTVVETTPPVTTGADYTILAGTSNDFTVRKESDQTTTTSSSGKWNGSFVSPGSIIEFEPGVHGMRQITSVSGTAADPIIIRSSPLGKATIRRAVAASGDFICQLRSCYHVKLDGSTTPGETYGIKIMYASSGTDAPSDFLFINNNEYANTTIGHPSSNITVSNVEIDGGWLSAGSTNGIGIGYSMSNLFQRVDWGSATIKDASLVFENCYVHDTEGEGFYIGDNYYKGSIGLANVIIRNNIVETTGWDGINLKGFWSGNNEIYSNRVINAGIKTDVSGGEHTGIPVLSSTANVYNNFIQFTGEKGIKFYNQDGPLESEFASFDCRAWNNIIYGAGANNVAGRTEAGGINFGIDAAQVPAVTKVKPFAFNNTVVDASDWGIRLPSSSSLVSGGFVKNNIIVSNSPSWSGFIRGSYISIEDNDSSNLATVSNNPTSATFVNAATYDFRLAAAVAASGTIGVDISATDYAGTTREPAIPDAGAYEYTDISQIVTDSMILHLDSANTSSYPGTGATWFDISGNDNDFNMYTNQTASGALPYSNEVFTFEGIDGYATDFANTTSSQLHLSPSGNRTIEVWFKMLSMPTRDTSNAGRDNRGVIVGNRYQENGSLCVFGGGIDKFAWIWDDGTTNYIPSNTTLSINTWYQVVILLRNIDNVTYYVNGALDTSEFVSPDLYLGTDTVQNWTIGKSDRGFAAANLLNGYTYLGTNMQMGIFRQYDKLLSSSEISHNFNAQRNRFGI